MAKPGFADRIQLLVSSATNSRHDGDWPLPSRSSKGQSDRWFLHISLLCLTLVSTTIFGCALARGFQLGVGLNEETLTAGYEFLFHRDARFLQGFAYAIPLILILLAHELGHYVTCRRWGVSASLPYFGPSPTLLGTIGAFIWIRSPIYHKRSLFDIGISGPIAGFAVALPVLVAGTAMSKTCPGGMANSSFSFGAPLLLRALEWLSFPGVDPSNLCLHPVAMAAWAGLLATAINLLPVGQLDGGHIVYALFGRGIHALFSWAVIIGLVVAGFLYTPWWIWAVAMFFFRHHPLIVDTEPLGRTRRLVGLASLVIFFLSFSLIPVRGG